MKAYHNYLVWLLVVGGLLLGYQGLTNSNLVEKLLGGQLEMVVNVIVGAAAVLVGYGMLSGKKRR
ncbi:DUF378 domain-containing protein [Candidatus Curtissbacteria bacterium]|nr:DUF378 domain-containing protein [Candidatus Curtissbacteria bacterium]